MPAPSITPDQIRHAVAEIFDVDTASLRERMLYTLAGGK